MEENPMGDQLTENLNLTFNSISIMSKLYNLIIGKT